MIARGVMATAGIITESPSGIRSQKSDATTPVSSSNPIEQRITISGKLFGVDDRKWYVKGLVYGPFAPNSAGFFLPDRRQLLSDLAHMRDLGANCIRLYHAPPPSFLDDALERGLRVMVDVPWEKHRCFFEDRSSQQDAIKRVRETAQQLG